MNRVWLSLCLIAATGLTVAGAVIQGHYSHRWGQSSALASAGKKLARVPERFGPWRLLKVQEFGPDTINMLQCAGYIHRTYENYHTGQTVDVAVIVGPPGPTAVHIPEICYSSKAYDIEGKTQRFAVLRGDGGRDEFRGVTFRSLDLGVGLLQVGYAWSDGEAWVAPDNPRFALWKCPVLYKIQFALPLPPSADVQNYGGCVEFLREFLPALDQGLVRPASE